MRVPAHPKDQAISFFCCKYQWIGASSMIISGRDYSAPEVQASEKALLAGITSVGMATLAAIQNSQDLHLLAQKEYVSALKLTNTALGNVTTAKADSTLVAVLLLAMFEVCTIVQMPR
jgi:Fungal specific transcription factor domain